MADGNISFAASDLFSIAAASKFQQTASTTRVTQQFAQAFKADGDICTESSAFDVRTDVTTDFDYCGSDFKTDLGTTGSAFGLGGSYLLDSVTCNWGNTAMPTLSVAGHNHTANAHASVWAPLFNWATVLPTAGGVGIPALGTNYTLTLANDTKATALTVTASVGHVDVQDSSGDHLAGTTFNFRLDLSASGVGLYSDLTLGSNWTEDDHDLGDANQGADTWAVTAHQYIART